MSKPNQEVYQPKKEVVTKSHLSSVNDNLNPETVLNKLKSFFEKYKKQVSYVGIGIVVLVAAYFGYNYYLDMLNEEAEVKMLGAVAYFEKDSLDKAMNGDGKNLGFLAILEDYSGTSSANLAKYYLGIIALKKGQFKEGIEYLESFSKPSNNLISAAAYSAIAYGYEELNDPASAANYYEQAARVIENNQTTPYYLMLAADNYEVAGQSSSALGIYKEIIKRFPNSQEKQRAERMVEKLSH
jgi:tetratricopeptide (TPR) repeat protein